MGHAIREARRIVSSKSGSGSSSTGVQSVVAGTNITVDNTDPQNPIVSSTADDITVVANYSALPLPNTVSGKFYWCSASQGVSWIPGFLGGTYYSAGLYYSNGVTWEFLDVPYQATQATVNTGTNTNQFVTPSTLANATSIINGSGTANQVVRWSGTKTQIGSSGLTYDGTIFAVGGTTNTTVESTSTGTGTTGAGSISAINTTNGSYAQIITWGSSASSTIFGLNRTGSSALILNPTTGGVGAVGTASNFPLVFATNNTERARIESDGKIILGVSGGTNYGSLNIWSSTSGATSTMYARNTSATGQFSYYFDNDRGGFASYGGFLYGGQSMASAGFFGASTRADKFFLFTDGASNLGFYTGTLTAQPYIIGTNNVERVRVTSTGELLIGTTSNPNSFQLYLSKSVNSYVSNTIENTSNGTAAFASITLINDVAAFADVFQYRLYSSGFTTSGLITARMGHLRCTASNGFLVSSDNGNIIFASGGTGTTNERLRLSSTGVFTYWDGATEAHGTTTGTKFGTATTQKMGWWNATPVVQPASANQAAVTTTVATTAATNVAPYGYSTQAQADDLITEVGQLKVLVNQLRSDLVTIGLIKGSA